MGSSSVSATVYAHRSAKALCWCISRQAQGLGRGKLHAYNYCTCEIFCEWKFLQSHAKTTFYDVYIFARACILESGELLMCTVYADNVKLFYFRKWITTNKQATFWKILHIYGMTMTWGGFRATWKLPCLCACWTYTCICIWNYMSGNIKLYDVQPKLIQGEDISSSTLWPKHMSWRAAD